MKKIVILIILFLVPVLALAQEKVVNRVELKNGTNLIGVVQVQSDGSYQVETTSGDVLVFPPSEVNRVVGVDDPVLIEKIVYKKGGQIRFLSTGKPLEQNDFSVYPDWEKYRGAQKKRKAGTIMMISGATVAVGSFAVFYVTFINDPPTDSVIDSYKWLSYGGIGIALTGLAFNIVGNIRLKQIAESFNQQPGYALDFGAQPHGVGVALHF